jgi:hypothetical protein
LLPRAPPLLEPSDDFGLKDDIRLEAVRGGAAGRRVVGEGIRPWWSQLMFQKWERHRGEGESEGLRELYNEILCWIVCTCIKFVFDDVE